MMKFIIFSLIIIGVIAIVKLIRQKLFKNLKVNEAIKDSSILLKEMLIDSAELNSAALDAYKEMIQVSIDASNECQKEELHK